MTEAIITFDHVVKEYRRRGATVGRPETMRAVDDVSLTIDKGDIFGIIGYSGAGKSTLVRLINALERPTSGTVTVLGQDVTGLSEAKLRPVRQKIGMIFQQFNLFSTKTVARNIAYPLQLDHWRKDYQDKRVAELLDFVGLSDQADKYPSQLSGGQKQRVGIARALATNPQILLADEATSALDPETTGEVLALLKRVNEEFGVTIVLITHQMSVVQQIANRVAVMSGGKVVEQGDVYNVFAAPQQAVTKRFIATAVSGLPEPARVASLHDEWSGRIVTVLIRQRESQGGASGAAVSASGQNISELIARYGVGSSLLYGGIDTVSGSAIGSITYEFSGDGDLVERFLAELSRSSDVIDFGTAAAPVDYDAAVAASGLSTVAAVRHEEEAR
ncbi:methionine ABC transporter ATP-binding protein [Bifidobacterium leontopitheci]|uniref:Methionine ABC transporter ATP-binding protein n=1 Tax=Bifidobacterium leontopitheci TaxID=2650774 RepID=A0A6I1GKZ5_9BIFI|nr:methionine ABC transporter ATP-binding protein [Bifidobacterium leontopitheci]KAB7790129.1 methionine ABC transporter ATP-binding protein [Bifidobacterium leontopitheci]